MAILLHKKLLLSLLLCCSWPVCSLAQLADVVPLESTGQELAADEQTPAVNDEPMRLQLSDAPLSVAASPADNSINYNPYGKKNYFGRAQFLRQIEITTDWMWLAEAIDLGTYFANKQLNEHGYADLLCSTWAAYTPPLKENGDELFSPVGVSFKIKDNLHLLRVGGKLGWTGGLNSCFGIYGRFYFEHRRHWLRLQHDDEHAYYRTNAIKPGLGIHFVPQFDTDVEAWNPYLELGTTYTILTSCKTPYGTDKEQFGSGLVYNFGIGVRNHHHDFFLNLELPQYRYFNRDWSPNGGFFYPYANIRDRQWSVSITAALNGLLGL